MFARQRKNGLVCEIHFKAAVDPVQQFCEGNFYKTDLAISGPKPVLVFCRPIGQSHGQHIIFARDRQKQTAQVKRDVRRISAKIFAVARPRWARTYCRLKHPDLTKPDEIIALARQAKIPPPTNLT